VRERNSKPASPSTAGQLQLEMVHAAEAFASDPQIKSEITYTWNEHELAHYFNDPEKSGEFGYDMQIILTESGILTSWIAYYMPFGERTPEEMMAIAEAPKDMSEQDKYVYKLSYAQWQENLKQKRSAAAANQNISSDPGWEAPYLSAADVVPCKDDETEEQYEERLALILGLSQAVDQLVEEGEIPPMSKITPDNILEFMENYWANVVTRYEENKNNVKIPTENEYYSLNKAFDENNETETVSDINNTVKNITEEIAKRVAGGLLIKGIISIAGLPFFSDFSINEITEGYEAFLKESNLAGSTTITENFGKIYEEVENSLADSYSQVL